jgi:hypothetical protein
MKFKVTSKHLQKAIKDTEIPGCIGVFLSYCSGLV